MKSSSTQLTAILIVAVFLITGCGESKTGIENENMSVSKNQSENVETANANISNDSLDELDKLIKLPILPEEATYREDKPIEQTDDNSPSTERKKLIVVFKFSAEDAQKVVEQIDKSKPTTASSIDAESWFPPELIAKSQESGDESLKGISYSADEFAKEPYKNGKLTHIDNTDFFVLEVTNY